MEREVIVSGVGGQGIQLLAKTEGIFAPLSILDNFAMPSLAADRRWGLLSPARGARRFQPQNPPAPAFRDSIGAVQPDAQAFDAA